MTDVVSMARNARMEGLASRFAEAHAMLDEAERLAGDEPVGLAWCAIERGRLYNTAGEPQRALPFFETSWNLARSAADHILAVDAAHMLAIAAPVDEAADWTRIALDYIDKYPVAQVWLGPLHNNIGWHYFEAGRFEEALESFQNGVRIRAAGGGRELRMARYAVIRTLRALGRVREATDLAEEVVRLADEGGETAPFVYEELAECHAATNPDRSRSFAQRALAALQSNRQFLRDEPARLSRLRELAGDGPAVSTWV